MWSYFMRLIHVQLALQVEQPELVYTLSSWFCFFTYLVASGNKVCKPANSSTQVGNDLE